MRLGGISEVAAELQVSRQRVSALREHPGFPEPVGEIAAGAVWDLDAVARWNSSGLRRTSAGRPSGRRRLVLGGHFALDPEPIGSGGFAEVFRATDLSRETTESHSVVAIKLLKQFDDIEIRRRFLRELRIVAGWRHPHVVPILEHGEEDEVGPWYAMPLAKGSLADEVDRFPGNEAGIMNVMRQLCEALEFVHTQGIFHRDLKPANVLRVGPDTWAISDFGLAREAERTTTALTSTLGGLGTFLYAAPELYKGAKYAEAAADIFSLGKILHELVSGEAPIGDEPQGPFRSVIVKATRSKADQRYATPSDFLAALNRAAATPSSWTTLEEAGSALVPRLRAEVADEAALNELVGLIGAAGGLSEAILKLRAVIPHLSRASLQLWWNREPEEMREFLEHYAEHVRSSSWEFAFCDVIADFFDRVILVTKDDAMLFSGLTALFEMGHLHNRWHVRDVAVGILQRIRENHAALAATEAIRDVGRSALEWTLSEFVVRSLHPTIRDATLEVMAQSGAQR